MNIDKSIKILKKRKKSLNLHIDNYYKKDCETAICRELIKERDAIENVLSELETWKKIAEKLAEKVEEIAYEMHLDEIYAELHNCNGIERNWNRGKEAEIKDIIDWAKSEVDK